MGDKVANEEYAAPMMSLLRDNKRLSNGDLNNDNKRLSNGSYNNNYTASPIDPKSQMQLHRLSNGTTHRSNSDIASSLGSDKKAKKGDVASGKWLKILYEYTQSTTLHGLVYVTQPQPFWIRRSGFLIVF